MWCWAPLCSAFWCSAAPLTIGRHRSARSSCKELTHADYLQAAFDPIRRYGSTDPAVATTLLRSLNQLRSEVERRGLPGPVEPLDAMAADVLAAADTELLPRETAHLNSLMRGPNNERVAGSHE